MLDRKRYLCVSNLGGVNKKLTLSEPWRCRVTGEIVRELDLGAGEIRFLVREEVRRDEF